MELGDSSGQRNPHQRVSKRARLRFYRRRRRLDACAAGTSVGGAYSVRARISDYSRDGLRTLSLRSRRGGGHRGGDHSLHSGQQEHNPEMIRRVGCTFADCYMSRWIPVGTQSVNCAGPQGCWFTAQGLATWRTVAGRPWPVQIVGDPYQQSAALDRSAAG